MILLDTNVLAALMPPVETRVVAWLDRQPRSSIWTSAVTVLEIRFGLLLLPPGKRRAALAEVFDALLAEDLAGRIAPFDAEAAEHAAFLKAARHQRGRPVEFRDTMIAGIAQASRFTLATRNTAHFADLTVPVVNPWEE